MTCDAVRRELMNDPAVREAALERHLTTCAECGAFARRLAAVRDELRAQRSNHLPGPGFALRVRAALPDGTLLLGWAAARLLPATVAALLVLTAWAWLATPSPSALVEVAPSDDPLGWAIDLEDGS